jgi:hypothetical protein
MLFRDLSHMRTKSEGMHGFEARGGGRFVGVLSIRQWRERNFMTVGTESGATDHLNEALACYGRNDVKAGRAQIREALGKLPTIEKQEEGDHDGGGCLELCACLSKHSGNLDAGSPLSAPSSLGM